MGAPPLTWSQAWRNAALKFWAREQPGGHFTTSAGDLVADRIATLVRQVDRRLGQPNELHVVDVGCGDGGLLALVRERCQDLAPRARWIGVDVRPPSALGIEPIVAETPAELALAPVRGLVMAHEWLDEIPCDVVERDDGGDDRLVLVDRDGTEARGPSLDDDAACAVYGVDAAEARSWLKRWWPLHRPGDRAEVGATRDRAWAWLAGLLGAGTALATDYGHTRDQRLDRHRLGTLAAYRSGRLVRPVPDGSVNLTAHVALDSCAAAVPGTAITLQRGEIEPVALGEDPLAADVTRHFAALRLRDPERLGGVAWLRWDA